MKQAVIAIVFALLGSLTSYALGDTTSPHTVPLWKDGPKVQLALDQWGNIIKPRLVFVDGDNPRDYKYELVVTNNETDDVVRSLPKLDARPWRAENIYLKKNTGGIAHSYNWSVISYDAEGTQVEQTAERRLVISEDGNEYGAGVKFLTGNRVVDPEVSTIDIQWRDHLPFEGATISLYYGEGENRRVIGGAENILVHNPDEEVDGVDTVTWSLAGVPEGAHNVYAIVSESNGDTVFDCCTISTPAIEANDPPELTVPNPAVFTYDFEEAGVPHSELESWLAQATATDDISGNVLVKNNLSDLPNPLPEGEYTVRFTATDVSNNTTEGSSSITINKVDSTAPVVYAPANISLSYTSASGGVPHTELSAWVSSVNAEDNLDDTVTVINNLYLLQDPLLSGVYTINFSASDQAGNVGSATSTVTITEDTTTETDTVAPVLTVPASETVEYAYGSAGFSHSALQYWIDGASANDDVDGPISVSNTLYLLSDPLLSGSYSITFTATDAAGNSTSNTSTLTIVEGEQPAGNQAPTINDQSLTVAEGQNLNIVLGPVEDADGDVLSYTVTGSDDFVAGATSNSIVFNSLATGQQTLSVNADDGRGGTDTATITVNVTAEEVVVPTNIAYNGWSTMSYTLSGQNTASSTSPPDDHNPSLFTLVGQMYAANGIQGYAHDFQFLPQGSEYIDGVDALDNINTTSATVAVLSAYGSTSGINMDPATANADGGWIDRMVNAAQAAQARGIKPIMFQSWGSAGTEDKFPNAKINSDALQAKQNMLIVRSAEIVEALGQLNSAYTTNTESPGGKFVPPVTHLYSGDLSDSFHGSYALAYANALATFKCLTGISAVDNQFVIPSGGAAGTQYGMSQQFINDIIGVVDNIQRESLVSGLAEGAAPIANNFTRDAEHGVELAINIASAAAVLDDVDIVPSNFVVKSINDAHYDSYSLNNNIFKITAKNTYTGNSDVVFTYTDADNQPVDFTMTVNIVPEIVIEPQEIIIGFGAGDWTSFGSAGNLYNHAATETGEVINGVRGFNSEATQGNLQDSNGVGIGSITSLTSGNLSGPGFAANESPVVTHYGPYTALYDSLSVAPKGTSVSFAINGLDADTAYRVNMAGRYPNDDTNIVSVNVNGVIGQYDSSRANTTEYEKVVATDRHGKLVISLSSDGTTSAGNWGLSYVHLNKITDGTPADVPVAPSFLQQPQSVNVTEGANATFSVEVSGTYSLQWYRDDVIINGETANTYTLTTTSGDDGAVFTARASNAGGTTISEGATLTLLTEPPVITQQPASTVAVMDGNKLSLNIVATGAVNYQWKKDGVNLDGQTSDSISIPVTMGDDGSNFTVEVSNPFGSVESNGTALTVNPLLQQYWFSLGRNDGRASNYTSSFTNFVPDIGPEGANGEDINFIRGFTESPVSHSGIFRDIAGNTTDLSVTFTSTGSNTAGIAGWGTINADILTNANVTNELSVKSWADHTYLYNHYLYMASGHEITLEFQNGGLVAGEEWKVEILGTHYQDESRPVDVLLNGVGTAGNLVVGTWDNIAIFDQAVNVDSSGKITLVMAPQVNANINAIRLIKTGN